jgi:branched-chain amino acid transport system ATP-binding protein
MRLEVTNIQAGYGAGADVLHGVSLVAESNSAIGVIGANGAGKSTLLKVICGFLKPRGGKVSIADKEASDLKPHRLAEHGIGYLMEGHSVFPSLTVEENLLLGTWSFRNDRARVKREIENAYAVSPMLSAKRKVRAGLLSGGQQRLLELERLALIRPSLIVLDEPSLGLAPKLVQEVFDRVAGLRISGSTILVVDQSARQICAVCDHVYVMRLGRIHMNGPSADFTNRIEEVVREFI